MHFIGQMLYFQEFQNRSIIVDESRFHYRRVPEVGVLTGYFTPKIPVIDKVDDELIKIVSDHYKLEDYRNQSHDRHQTFRHSFKPHEFSNAPFFVINLDSNFWNMINAYRGIDNGPRIYNKLRPLACDNLQFNEAAKQEIRIFLESQNVPIFPRKESVAFHIRRGDKHTEANPTSTDSYIEKMQDYVNRTTAITDCFIGTDQYSVVEEAIASLRAHNFTCQVHTLTLQNQTGGQHPHYADWEQGLPFFATLYQFIHASYFMGTFSSNIGRLVALIRGCDDPAAPSDDFYHSYGVDSDSWYMGMP